MFCPSCGAEVGVGRKFCGKCGAAVRASVGQGVDATRGAGRDPAETKPSPSPQPSSPRSKVIYALVALLAILGGVAWWWFHRPEADNELQDSGIYPFNSPSVNGNTPKVGFVDADGKILIQPEWDAVGSEYLRGIIGFNEGLCAVRKDGKWGYIDAGGRVVIPSQFDSAGPFVEGLAGVKLGSLNGYIDKTGSYAINPQFESAGAFHEGLAAVHADTGWGFINKEGVYVVKPDKGRNVPPDGFSGGLAVVCASKCGYVDHSGTFAIRPQFNSAATFSDGLAAVQINKNWGYINTAGKIVVNPQFDSATRFSGGLAVVSVSGRQGVINKQGKYIVNPGQYNISPREGNLQQVSTSDGMGLMTRDGKWAISPSKALTGVGVIIGKVFYGKIGDQVVPISMSGKVLVGWYKGASLDSLAQDIENESRALQSMRMLTSAEASYSGAYPTKGFAAAIPALGPTVGTPDENHAGFIDAALATGAKDGYLFTASAPNGASSSGPNLNYFIAGKPAAGHAGRTFCADSSGAVHYAMQGEECAVTEAFPIAAYGQASVAADRTAQAGAATQAVPNNGGVGQNPSTNSSDSSRSTAEAEQWVSRAENQFQQADYRSAIQSCDAALRAQPGNAKARQLKAKIEETMRILGKN